MGDNPRGRRPATPGGDRPGRATGSNRADESRRDSFGERSGQREGQGHYRDHGPRFSRREQRPSSAQPGQRRVVHYQVVMMDDEEWGDSLENRLNALGHDGWRLVAIDDGRQYVFMQTD